MILKSSILSWPGAHFKKGPRPRFISRCWDITSEFSNFVMYEFQNRKCVQRYMFTFRTDPESISNDARITPESLQSNFHAILGLQDPKTIDFQLKSNEQFKSMSENWLGKILMGGDNSLMCALPFCAKSAQQFWHQSCVSLGGCYATW